MKLNRIISILAIIGSAVFVSYYGGNISYAIFFLTVFVPIISFLYTTYVYIRFKLYQSMGSLVVVKGDWIDYSFIIANEDVLTFRNIKVNFIKDKSTIEDTELVRQYSLLPGESDRLDTRIKCNYRGEYHVGVDTVEVTDFLYLFSITYPVSTKLKAVVLPRVVPIERLGLAPPEMDVKNPLHFSNSSEEELDTEIRRYYPGDHKKRIHWKATARHQELVSRKYHHKPKAEIFIFMDTAKVMENELNAIIVEDKIIESVLAIANYYALRGSRSHVIYEMGETEQFTISSKIDFNVFYKACAGVKFEAKTQVSDLIQARSQQGDEGMFYVAVTHLLTKEFYMACLRVMKGGNHMCVLLISDDVSAETENLVNSLKLAGVNLYRIMSEDEIGEVLSRDI